MVCGPADEERLVALDARRTPGLSVQPASRASMLPPATSV